MADGGKSPSSSFPRPPLSSSSPFPNPNSNTTAATPSTIPASSSSLTPSTAPRGGFAIGVPANRPSQTFATFGPSPPPSSSLHHGRGVNQGMHNIGNSFGSQPQRLAQTPIRQTPPPFSTPSFNPQRMGTPSSSLTQHHMHATIPSYKPSQLQQQQRPIQTPSQIQQQQQQQRPLQTPSQTQQQRPIQTPSQIQQQRPIQTPSQQQQQQQMRPIQQQMRPYQTPLSHLQMTPMNNMNVNPNRVPISGPIGPIGPLVNEEEEGDRILSKRTIHELFSQIDPSEKVEADVEDVLIEVAEDFVESLTTFACSLAKHRKSSTLEAKDILLHAERNWNITLPGFSGDDVKMYKKQNVNDIHRERLALIKKSMGDPRRANYLTGPPGAQNKP